MLRRSKKTSKRPPSDHAAVLGITRNHSNIVGNDLEAIVFGGEHDIVERLEDNLPDLKVSNVLIKIHIRIRYWAILCYTCDHSWDLSDDNRI